ncbi:MAG: type I methionyl aminopeptidase [Puniceicoccales bacterium]
MVSEKQIPVLREACEVAARVLADMADFVGAGMNTYDLDQFGKKRIAEYGAESACYQYRVRDLVFPSHTCLSVNDEIVHGIGRLDRQIQEGDVVSIDVVVRYHGMIGDNARTVIVGKGKPADEKLLAVTRTALNRGIEQAVVGNRVGDISHTIQNYVEKNGFSVVRDFVGHGVGETMHEEPQIPNFGRRRSGPKLVPGMALAIEPMVNAGTHKIEMLGDGWTAVTKDRKRSAHFEHTVLITDEGPEILTVVPESAEVGSEIRSGD